MSVKADDIADTKPQESVKLKRLNQVLGICVILLGLYIAVTPFIPDIVYRFHHENVVPYDGKLETAYGGNAEKPTQPQPKDNRLVIPEIGLNERVKEGPYIKVLNDNGVWRRPKSSSSPDRGNMVIIGHRFLYNNPYGTFYHLDKIKVGSKIGLYWNGSEHVYVVQETKVVSPTQGDVEAQTAKPQLTLYTCTPLLSAKNRLIIVATEVQ